MTERPPPNAAAILDAQRAAEDVEQAIAAAVHIRVNRPVVINLPLLDLVSLILGQMQHNRECAGRTELRNDFR